VQAQTPHRIFGTDHRARVHVLSRCSRGTGGNRHSWRAVEFLLAYYIQQLLERYRGADFLAVTMDRWPTNSNENWRESLKHPIKWRRPAEVAAAVERLRPTCCLIRSVHLNE
jgi:hypothetical protein